jgi:FKBP-type peptidyl-prolyl cis-trans isomerase FkpA
MIKKYYRPLLIIMVTGLLISLVSCNPAKKYEKDEQDAIDNYLKNSDLVFTQTASGLYYSETKAGDGLAPATHDTVYVRYTGRFLNGTVLDTNVGEGGEDFVFPLGEGYAIYGFDEAVSYMKVNGKATVVIPSSLAYGSQGYNIIPGYTPLEFELELVKVVPSGSK